jgi:hypothetical protein
MTRIFAEEGVAQAFTVQPVTPMIGISSIMFDPN